MRVVIADDELLLREGLAKLLEAAGVEVVGLASDSSSLLKTVALDQPDVAIVDIKMPPTHTDEGLQAAVKIRHNYPNVAVLVLSHYLDTRYAIRLLEEQTGGLVTCSRSACRMFTSSWTHCSGSPRTNASWIQPSLPA